MILTLVGTLDCEMPRGARLLDLGPCPARATPKLCARQAACYIRRKALVPNLLGQAPCAPQVLPARGELVARQERRAAPAQRTRRELPEARTFYQREQLVRVGDGGGGFAARERELGQAFEAARELEAFAVLPAILRRALERRTDVEPAQAQARDREMRLDARAPERDARAARELEAALAPRRRLARLAAVEQQVPDEVVGDELVADLLQAFQPAQRPRHPGERFVVLSGAGAQVVEPEQRRAHVPLEVGLARDLDRSVEGGRGARIVGEAHVPGLAVADHHPVLAFVALVADAARELERALVAGDRRRRLHVVVVRLAAAVIGLHSDKVGEPEALADFHRLAVECDRLAVAAVAPGHRAEVIKGIGRVALVVHGAAFGERPGQALRRALVVVGAAVGHAELDDRIAGLLSLAACRGRL